ncbi:MAG: hypothetical protein QNL14_15235 [Deltaproteobacteria bacterium]|nr:hypothetical protein [Deltaproteobacteria bacterium]
MVSKKLLWENNILLESEDIGGALSRTVHFNIATGQAIISSNGLKREL